MAGAKVEIIRYLEWAETDAAGHQHYTSAFRGLKSVKPPYIEVLDYLQLYLVRYQELRYRWSTSVGFFLASKLKQILR